jgi:hypothetical protein
VIVGANRLDDRHRCLVAASALSRCLSSETRLLHHLFEFIC